MVDSSYQEEGFSGKPDQPAIRYESQTTLLKSPEISLPLAHTGISVRSKKLEISTQNLVKKKISAG